VSAREPDTAAVLEELADTLAALRRELEAADGDTGAGGGDAPGDDRHAPDRPRRRSPPSAGDLLRFTEEYTIPTVIATLEATIAALELLRGLLRLVDPDRRAVGPAAGRAGGRLAAAGDSAVGGVERALSELRTALSAADLPEDESARRLIEDARALSETVEDRLDDARRTVEGEPGSAPDRDRERGVSIDVREEDAAERGAESDGDDEAGVDVEAELESIRAAVERDDGDESDAADDGDEGGSAQSSTGSNR
jgi:hypothetical protein